MSISHKFRTLRKAIATIASAAVFTMAVTVAPQASAQTFDDVSSDHWAYDYVEQLVTDGVIDANDTYRPDDGLNRAELVKIAVEATTGIQTDLIPDTPTFDDVPATMWYFQYVETAAALGIVEGYKDASGNMTGLFGPGDTVNRAAGTKILVNAYGVATDLDPEGIFNDVDEDAWYYDYVTTAYNQSIIDGYKDADGELTGDFGPGDPVTRAQVAKLAVNSTNPVERVVDADDEDDDEEPADPGETADGDLEVSLSADSMESATIPRSANVAVASFDLTAGADDIKVTALTMVRGGVGSRTAISSLVLKDQDGNRISKSKTINSDDEVTFTLLSGGITIEAGETTTAIVVIATAAAGTGNHNFKLVAADAVSSNAQDVVADFPVVSNTFEIGSAAAGAVDMTNDGTPATVKIGETDATIAKFKLENSNVEDVAVTQITLKETGTANEADALDNIKLLANGDEVATGTLNDKYIAFVFDAPLEILKNKNVKFKVTADIIGEAAKTLSLDLDSLVDIEGTGDNFGFGIGVTDNFTATALTIDAGAITLSKTEPNDKMRKDKKDVVLATVNVVVNSGDAVEMKAFNADIVTTGNNIDDLFENIELHDVASGSVYDLTASATATMTATYYDRDIGISFEAGEEKSFEVRADIKNVAGGIVGDTVVVSFSGVGDSTTTDGIDFQETTDDTFVTDVVPGSLSFKTITGEASTVTASIVTMSSTKNAVIGTEGVEVLEFIVEPGSASAVNVNEMVVSTAVVNNSSATTATVATTTTAVAEVAATATSATAGDLLVTADTAGTTANGNTLTIVVNDALNATANASAETATAITIEIDSDSNASTFNQVVTEANLAGTFLSTVTSPANGADNVVAGDAQVMTLAGGVDGVAQVSTITTSAELVAGETLTAVVAGTTYAQVFATSHANTLTTLAAAIQAGEATVATAVAAGNVITITGNAAGATVTLTATVTAATAAGTADNTRINKVTLYQKDGSTLTELDSKSGSQYASNAITFDSLDIDIEASGTARFLVAADVVDDSTQAADTLQFGLKGLTIDDDDSDTITSIDVDGTTYTAPGTDPRTSIAETSARVVTIVGVGSLSVAADTTDTKTDKAKLILGNTTSDYVASFELNATNEAVKVKDLNLVGAGATAAAFKSAVSDIIIYDEDDNEIGRESVTGLTTTFDNIDYVVSEGSENVYVKVKAAKQGKDAAGSIVPSMTLAMSVTDADGDSSNKAVSGLPIASASAATSLAFSTVPTRISGAEFVSSCGSKTVTTKLTNGSNDVAILKLTTDASTNTKTADGSALKTNLNALRFTVLSDAKGTVNTALDITNTANAADITVEKINGTGDNQAELTSMTAGAAVVNLTTNTTTTTPATAGINLVNKQIDNSTSVCYLIKANLSSMTPSAQGYIQIQMNNLDSTVGSANIEYDSDGGTATGQLEATAADRAALLLSDSTIEATKVSSSY